MDVPKFNQNAFALIWPALGKDPMAKTKPRLAQLMCGPNRHCILAVAYQPGVTGIPEDIENPGSYTFDVTNAGAYLVQMADRMIETRGIKPLCEICNSPRGLWKAEDHALAFDTLEEATPFLKKSAEEQRRAAVYFRSVKS